MSRPIQITATLWALPSRSMSYNAGVLASAGQAWLIDPGPHPDEVAAAAALAAQLPATIVGLALTHSHWDHILGPEHLPSIPALAHERFDATLQTHHEHTAAMVSRWEARFAYGRSAPFAPPHLHATVADGQRIALGELELLLLHIPGHAVDQLAIFEPAAGALWAADTLSDIEIPFVSHSLGAYQATLDRLAALPIQALVPGHGHPTADRAAIQGRLDADRAYLADLRGRIAAVVQAGGGVEEAVAACASIDLRSPAQNAGPHRLNVESVYIELGGEADPARVGWSQDGLIDE